MIGNRRPRMVSPFLLVSGGVWTQRFIYREWTRPEPVWGVMVGARLFLPIARGKMYVAPEVGFAPLIYPHTPNFEDALITVAAPLTFGIPLRGQDDPATGFAQDASGRSSSVGMTVGSAVKGTAWASTLASRRLVARGRIRAATSE